MNLVISLPGRQTDSSSVSGVYALGRCLNVIASPHPRALAMAFSHHSPSLRAQPGRRWRSSTPRVAAARGGRG
jgi:hypothetical protein